LNRTAYLAAVTLVAACVAVAIGPGVALIAIATTALIAFAAVDYRPLRFLGSISYSLYLVHVPIGGRVMNVVARLQLGPFSAVVVTLGAFLVSVVAAYAFHAAIEGPARKWAAAVNYGDYFSSNTPAGVSGPTTVGAGRCGGAAGTVPGSGSTPLPFIVRLRRGRIS
jgi:peptidoglycan/LPS O-acetylase OafA/YrhL